MGNIVEFYGRMGMDKKQLSERDIITKYIIPAVEKAGWDKEKQIREEVNFTDGRIIVRKKIVVRGKRKRADIILYPGDFWHWRRCTTQAP